MDVYTKCVSCKNEKAVLVEPIGNYSVEELESIENDIKKRNKSIVYLPTDNHKVICEECGQVFVLSGILADNM